MLFIFAVGIIMDVAPIVALDAPVGSSCAPSLALALTKLVVIFDFGTIVRYLWFPIVSGFDRKVAAENS